LKPIGRTLVTALVAHSVKDADQLVTSSMFLSLNLQLQESDIPIEELTRDVKEASLSIVQLAKLKRMAEKFAKLIFLDTDFQPVVFMNKLKRTFFNYSPLVVTQEFSGMLKNIIQESGLKRVLPSEPKESWLYIKIPMHSALEIDGSLKLAAYCSMKLSLTIEQQVIEKTCRLKQIHFKIEEKRGADGDEILATKITFMRSIDFFVDFE
jgi:hypothetical protein